MSLVREQCLFLRHVAKLIRRALDLGFVVTGGELYRTPEQQALYVKNGRSKTMSSQHLKRLAIDLNFFRETEDGRLELSYDVEAIRPLGEYWEGLDPANRWGGNWHSFKDTAHFERREGSLPAATDRSDDEPRPAVSSPVAEASPPPVVGNIVNEAVGPKRPNHHDDVATVQRLLNLAAARNRFHIEAGRLKPDGVFGHKTLHAIMAFQRAVLGQPTPGGQIDPNDATLSALCQSLEDATPAESLGLIYLKADEHDLAELAEPIFATMEHYRINTGLRQAHFLAQIGHESGELRFREEIASGAAYEGRHDLGNIQPGDGRRFKGRGLIQLTGRANYAQYGRDIGREQEILQRPQLVAEDPALCVDVAGWYWNSRKLNSPADADDLLTVTRRINGGLNGLEDRRRLLQRSKSVLALGSAAG